MHPRPAWLLATLLAACAGQPATDPPASTGDDASDPSAEVDPPTEYTYTPDEGATAVFDPDAIEVALDDAITKIPLVTATPVLDAYALALEQMEPGCPDWYDYDGNVFWYATCTTDSGSSFDGYGFTTLYEDADAFGDGSSWDLIAISGSATIRDPEGYTFHLGGGIYDGTGSNDDGARLWVSQVAGGFWWDHPQGAGSWMDTPSSPSILLYAIQYDVGANVGNYVYLSGSVADLSEAATAVRFDDIALGDVSLGLACAAEPTGTLSVRDDAGVWWDVKFDYDDRGRLTGDCDGCGGVWTGDTYHGDVCADFSSLIDWEASPW